MPALETPNWEQNSPFRQSLKRVVRMRISGKTKGRRCRDREGKKRERKC